MPDVVISDTSCLVVLDKIDKILILKQVYSRVITTPQIAAEFNQSVPDWIAIQSPKNIQIQLDLESKVDPGEASALALGLEISGCTIILDDLKARKVAEKLKLNYTGTLGVLVKAKKMGVIPEIKSLVQRLQIAGLRFSEEVKNDILLQAGEL